jgi:tetratricopeptide (TPR) repeat protein
MATVRLVGASIPRSGHHFLVRVLKELLGADFGYCEFYTPVDCCRQVPCVRTEGFRLFFQKNHDLDLQLAADIPGVFYVVQHREPALGALSDREYLADLGETDRAADRDEYVVWLGKRASHYVRFYRKWIEHPPARSFLVEYEELRGDPVGVVTGLMAACGLAEPDPSALAKAVGASSGMVAPGHALLGDRVFRPRTLTSSLYLDEDLLSAYEAAISASLPEAPFVRRFPPVPFEEHPVGLVFRAELARADGRMPEALALYRRASRKAPENPFLLAELARFVAAHGSKAEAVELARLAACGRPGHGPLLRYWSDLQLARADEELDRALEIAERLVEALPADPGSLVHLAAILLKRGSLGAAMERVRKAAGLGPADPYVWRYASEVFAAGRSWDESVDAARQAILRAPFEAEYHHHLGNMLFEAGRIDEADEAHGRANALSPNVAGWRWKHGEDLLRGDRRSRARNVVREALLAFPDDPALLDLARRIEVPDT